MFSYWEDDKTGRRRLPFLYERKPCPHTWSCLMTRHAEVDRYWYGWQTFRELSDSSSPVLKCLRRRCRILWWIELFDVGKQIRKTKTVRLFEKNWPWYPNKHQNLSIFCFYMIYLSLLVLELWVIKVCVFLLFYLMVGKKCQPRYKNNG